MLLSCPFKNFFSFILEIVKQHDYELVFADPRLNRLLSYRHPSPKNYPGFKYRLGFPSIVNSIEPLTIINIEFA
jgi:hypothetical protein